MLPVFPERLKHAVIAMLLAFAIAASTILRPLDMTIWSIQSKMFDRTASGDIVLALVNDPAGDAGADHLPVADAIMAATQAGADRIFVDMPMLGNAGKLTDRELDAIRAQGRNRVTFVTSSGSSLGKDTGAHPIHASVASRFSVADNDFATDFLGYVWFLRATAESGSADVPTLGFSLAGQAGDARQIGPDYTIDPQTVPTFAMDNLLDDPQKARSAIAGKTVIISALKADDRSVNLLKSGNPEATMVHILAAETLLRNSGQTIHWSIPLVAAGVLMMLGLALARTRSQRRLLYTGVCAAFVVSVVLLAAIGARAFLADTIALIVIFGIFRLISGYKRRHLLIEQRSGLPNFVAFERDFSDPEHADTKAIVVVKNARLDAVFAMLKPSDQTKYLRTVASRLAVANTDINVYYDGGKYFAFAITKVDHPDLQSHLEGLRAINCQPISVAGEQLDVSITMGVERNSCEPVGNRLSSAIAAADQAREAYKPVFVIDDAMEADKSWDYSLQARLEEALSQDKIAIRLQPQINLQTMQIVAAEALARWHDVKRGEISPSQFVRQCERVGRLDELTKRIIGKTFETMLSLEQRGHDISLSINVSAIQFVDHRIADMMAAKLSRLAVDPGRLTIEITETARIENMAMAREALDAVKAQGMRLAMDDFGMASANLEPLLELPFDEIKIDQTFVKQMWQSPKARAIVSNAVRLIGDAGMTSVAEGIEDWETLDSLRNMGCEIGQGNYIGVPLTFDQMAENLDLQRDSPILNKNYS